MELLLILSAMLSAVTGAFTGVRGPEGRIDPAQAAVGAHVVVSAVEQQAPAAKAERPAPSPIATEVASPPSFAVAPAAPLYADRLIE